MKKLMKKVFVVLGVAVILVACEKKEPTALELDSIESKVKVCGYVTYDKKKNDGATNVVKKASAEVTIDVALSQYNSSATGTKRYTATTNANGYYEIELPVKEGKSLPVTINTSFITDCYGYNTIEAAWENVPGLFKASGTSSILHGQQNVVDLAAGATTVYPNSPDFH